MRLVPPFVIASPASAGRGAPARRSSRGAIRWLLLLSVSLLLAAASRAQTVRWQIGDDPNDLTLVFENCSPAGQPLLPPIDGAQLAFAGSTESSQSSFGAGGFTTTRSVILTYRWRARGAMSIPVFDVKTDKGTLHVPAFTLSAAAAARPGISDTVATSRFQPANLTIWAGEVFPLTYTLDVARRNFTGNVSNIDWNVVPLVAEEWSKPEPAEVNVNGEARAYIVYRSRAYAKASGTLSLNSITQAVNIQTGSTGFGIFQTARIEQLAVESNHPQITVRALPPAPPGFGGAVGQFKLASKVVPENAAVGEPVTWTLELSGAGNWPDFAGLPARDVSNDFQVVQPKAKRTPAEGKLFDVTLAEDVVLVPTKPGSYTLGPVNFVYFDPKSGGYKTLSAPRTALTITTPSAPKLFNVAPSATEPATPAPEVAAKTSAPPATPAPPAGLPRDPLPGAEVARVPLATGTLVLWLLSPVLCLLFFWTWLALRRAQQTDPVRLRREARVRLAATLTQLRNSSESEHSFLLLAWQHDAAVLWQLAHAAPPAAALTDAAWSALWAEADRALYGPKTALPSDWLARAEAALVAKRVPGFNPLRLFLPRNLLPFAALFALLVIPFAALRAADDSSAVASAKADPATAYRRGDFAAAEKIWRATVAKSPTDWIARHNLSLALAQQDHAGEAAAHADAAFVQNPADPSVRWHFALAADKANFAPAPLAPFLTPGPVQSLARLASPAEWQLVLIAAAFGAALALGWMLFNSYGRRSRAVLWSASAALMVCVLIAAGAVVGVLAYGETAGAHAVVVWRADTLRSIPTEADTTQKTTSLAAGSVGLADKTFLGWTRLSFANGQTGWVRKEALVALWK